MNDRAPIYDKENNYYLIPIFGGGHAIVDECDVELVSKYKWSLTNGYPKAHIPVDGKKKKMSMHLLILGKVAGFEIDHRNRIKHDNRRSNLRSATHRQNGCNTTRKNKYGYRGIDKNGKKYSMRIQNRYEGPFDTPEEAAKAYDRAARILQGEFAVLNFTDNKVAQSS